MYKSLGFVYKVNIATIVDLLVKANVVLAAHCQ